MNTATKVGTPPYFSTTTTFLLSRQFWLSCLLVSLILLSALALVYTRDVSRFTFIQMHQLMQNNSALKVHWGQLLLEKSSWSTARIQHIAQTQLDMQAPIANRITMVYQ